MANTRSANVIVVDTTAAYVDATRIHSIKYIGAVTSSVTLKSGGVSTGVVIWEENATTNVWNPNVDIVDTQGVYVTVTGTAKAYLYLK